MSEIALPNNSPHQQMLLCNDLLLECLSFLPIKKIIKMRNVSRNWAYLIDNHQWDFSNHELVVYYRTIYEKRMNWFLWLNKNNIDPNFTRTKNMIAFSIWYSSPEIVKWFMDNNYPLSPLENDSLELNAIIRSGRNSQKIALLNNHLKKLIREGRREYGKWLQKLNDPLFLFYSTDIY